MRGCPSYLGCRGIQRTSHISQTKACGLTNRCSGRGTASFKPTAVTARPLLGSDLVPPPAHPQRQQAADEEQGGGGFGEEGERREQRWPAQSAGVPRGSPISSFHARTGPSRPGWYS